MKVASYVHGRKCPNSTCSWCSPHWDEREVCPRCGAMTRVWAILVTCERRRWLWWWPFPFWRIVNTTPRDKEGDAAC
jgi:hypothetical protein